MRETLRTTILAVTLLLLGITTAPAQTYDLVASESELTPSSGNTDAECLVQLSTGDFVFFNPADGGIFKWDTSNSSLSVHRSSSDLDSDVSGESGFDNCDGAAVESGFIYFILRSSSTNNNILYRTEASDASNNASKEFSGANALATDGSTLYIAGIADFGAPSNGIFEVSSDLSNSVSELASNSDLSPKALSLDGSGTLYGYSESGNGSNFEAEVFTLDVTESSPSFNSFADPYTNTDLTQADAEISDLEFITFGGTDYLVVFNNTFSGGPEGQEWGTIRISDQSVERLFTSDDLTSNLSVSGYDGTYPLVATDNGEIFVASTSSFGSPTYIASVNNAPPLPVEMAGFDAVKNDNAVALTWQTASETNNAGFRVQHQGPGTESWTNLGFVESKATGGTTTEALSYRYTVDRELDPGTHRFRLQQKDLDGSTSLSGVETIDVGLNAALTLQAPMPNPARGQATVKFGVKEATETSVAVYNVLGQRVKTLYQGTPQAGQMNDVEFNASTLPSGVYFVRMQADGQTRTERLTVVR